MTRSLFLLAGFGSALIGVLHSVVLDLVRLLSPGSSLTRWTLFSAIALAIGLLYLVPTLMSWKALMPVTRPETATASG